MKDIEKKLAPKDILVFDKSEFAVKMKGTAGRKMHLCHTQLVNSPLLEISS